LKATHSERINFLHVEVYDNPPEIRENGISVAKLSPILTEWGLPTEPWTFVIDAEGLIRAKYEGFVSSVELEEAITSTLGGS
jgi:peroxiredoxin